MATSPILRDADSGDDISRRILPTDAAFGSGSIQSGVLSDASVVSGSIGSGQIGQFHVSSGAVTSGRLGVAGTPNGTLFLRDDFTWAAAGGAVASGSIGSGLIASGAVQGFFGSTRHVASGTVGSFDFGSGAVVAGSVGSGAVQSANVGSGQVGQFHVSSGAVTSGRLGVTGIPGNLFLRDDFSWAAIPVTINSGDVGSGKIASGAVQGSLGSTRHIASGTVGRFDLASGAYIDCIEAILSTGNVSDATALLVGMVPAWLGGGNAFLTRAYGPNASGAIVGTAGGDHTAVVGLALDVKNSGEFGSLMMEGFVPITSGAGLDGGPGIIAIATLGAEGFPVASGLGGGGTPWVPCGTSLSGFNGAFYFCPGRALENFILGKPNPFNQTLDWLSTGSVTSGCLGGYAFFGNAFPGTLNIGQASELSFFGVFVTDAWHVGQETAYDSNLNSAWLYGSISTKDASGAQGSGVAVPFGLTRSGGFGVRANNLFSTGMPSIGLCVPNVSGDVLGASFTHYLLGRVDSRTLGDTWTSGFDPGISGSCGKVVFVGASGGLRRDVNSGGRIQVAGVGWRDSVTEGVFLRMVPQTSGFVGIGQLASGNVVIGTIASGGVIGVTTLTNIASGSIGSPDLGSGAVRSGNIASGQVSTVHLSSGTRNFTSIIQVFTTAELISGVKAVALASGSGNTIVRAERQSGLRLPAIGVTRSGATSGNTCDVVMFGYVGSTTSGSVISGFHGRPLYVGSGGFIVNQSGYRVGPASGAPTLSGSAVQMIGIKISGGIFVNCLNETRPTSGLYAAAGQGNW